MRGNTQRHHSALLHGERRQTRRSLGRSVRPLLAAWLFAALGWSVLSTQRSIPVDQLLLDPAALGSVAWYTGAISSLGILLWGASVCACIAISFVTFHAGRGAACAAFGSASLLFGFLLADDLLQLHFVLLPELLGISKRLVLIVEGLAGVIWVTASWRELRRTRWQILAAALGLFAVSALVDTFFWHGLLWWTPENLGTDFSRSTLLLEDGPKFFGALALAVWSIVTAADVIRSVVTQSAPNSSGSIRTSQVQEGGREFAAAGSGPRSRSKDVPSR